MWLAAPILDHCRSRLGVEITVQLSQRGLRPKLCGVHAYVAYR